MCIEGLKKYNIAGMAQIQNNDRNKIIIYLVRSYAVDTNT